MDRQHGVPGVRQSARPEKNLNQGKLKLHFELSEEQQLFRDTTRKWVVNECPKELKTTAVKTNGGWILNGEKIWDTTTDTANYLRVLARTGEPEHRESDGVSLFFMPRTTKGVTCTHLPKMGMRAVSSCSVHFENALVADDLLLGKEGSV